MGFRVGWDLCGWWGDIQAWGGTSKGGPLECGVLEFGGRALNEGVWVGFRPSVLEGVSECRGRVLGGGVGAGLGLCMVEGRIRPRRDRKSTRLNSSHT